MLALLILGDWTFVVLRLALGALFLAHGWPKISNLKKTQEGFEGMGFKPGKFWGTLVAIAEFFGGAALVLGFLAHLTAFVLAIQFAVIVVWKIRKGDKFVGGWEFDLVILAGLLVLMAYGAGIASFDQSILLRGW